MDDPKPQEPNSSLESNKPQRINQFGIIPIFLVLAIILLVIGGGVYYFLISKQSIKPNSSQTQNTTSDGNIYTNTNLGYQFTYPLDWQLTEANGNSSSPTLIHKTKKDWKINFGFISASQLRLMGITYCGAYPKDKNRCETLEGEGFTAGIDWGNENRASVVIAHPTNEGLVTFGITPVNSETKSILKNLLSTFKFTDKVAENLSWKTYEDAANGYELKYPSELKLKEVTIGPLPIEKAVTLTSDVGEITFPSIFPDWSVEKTNKIMAGGIEAEEMYSNDYTGTVSERIIVKVPKVLKNSQNFYIRYVPSTRRKLTESEIESFHQIISTVKFTNQNNTFKTFTNPVYKYKFDYPATYTIRGTNENYVDVLIRGDMEHLTIWAESDFSDGSTSNMSFSDFAVQRASILCSADGPTGGTYCDEKPIKQIPFTTDSGVQGYELYLKETEERFNVELTNQPAKTEIRTIGPLFVLDVSKQTNNKIRILIITGERFSETPSDTANKIRDIVKTIRF